MNDINIKRTTFTARSCSHTHDVAPDINDCPRIVHKGPNGLEVVCDASAPVQVVIRTVNTPNSGISYHEFAQCSEGEPRRWLLSLEDAITNWESRQAKKS